MPSGSASGELGLGLPLLACMLSNADRSTLCDQRFLADSEVCRAVLKSRGEREVDEGVYGVCA